MQEIRNRKAHKEAFAVDNTHFVNCEFLHCDFSYGGGDFQFTNCSFTGGVELHLTDAASRTVDFLNIFSRFILGGKRIPKTVH